MFILPLTGKSEPIDLELRLELGRDAVLDDDFWPISHGLTKREKPVPPPSKAPSGSLNEWVPYLYSIDPSELTYEEWLEKVGFALHYETNGSDEGFDLWDAWSSQSAKYSTTEYGRYKWDSIRNDKARNVTGQTLINMARERGYNADIVEEFDNEEGNVGTVAPLDKGDMKAAVGEARKPLPKFSYNKNGEIEATINNVKKAIERPDLCGWLIKYDAFRDEIMYKDEAGWHQFTDHDYTRLRERLEANSFRPITKDMMRDVVGEVADTNRFDSAIEWINALPAWDGVERIDNFLVNYMGAEDTPYVRAVGAYMWTAMAGRVLSPGIQVDMVPILEGKQGIRKSSAVKMLVPHKELFCNISFGEKEDDLARKMRGRLIAEIGELKGLHSRDLETIKDFVTRTHENWVPKFKEFSTTFPRRLIFLGTTNQAEFLADDTGNRRWLPVHVEICDTDAIERDRNQLWAEARARFLEGGVAFHDAERLADGVHEKYMMHDTWQDTITTWLSTADLDGKSPSDNEFLQISDILRDALGFDIKQVKRADEMRVGKILRALGYERSLRRVDGKPSKVWVNENANSLD